MSVAVVRSRALLGLHAPDVGVEVHVANGLPAFHIVGLPQASVRESRDRVRAALLHCGFEFPNRRLTVNLAPADLPKDSGRFDLPIAIGILVASRQLPGEALAELELVGELSLTGELRPIRGILAMALAVRRDPARRRLVVPGACAGEAAMVPDCRALSAASLIEVCSHFRGEAPLVIVNALGSDTGGDPSVAAAGACAVTVTVADRPTGASAEDTPDLSDVRGQAQAKRALEIAAAGEHSLLMVGPPGVGKSMLAHRLAGLLPPLDDDAAFEAAALSSLVGRFDPRALGRRPFRAPHHGASTPALVGGGAPPRPGEISLAHQGVLFLDELPEFGRQAIEALREPLEEGRVTISRALRQAEFPARFQLVAAMNPCPCGYLGHPSGRCHCPPERIARYRQRISGPLLDRIDLRLQLPALRPEELLQAPPGEPSVVVRERVLAARQRQAERQRGVNARLAPAALERACALNESARALLRQAMQQLQLSGRGYHRILRLARTVADLAADPAVCERHLAEALQFRGFDV